MIARGGPSGTLSTTRVRDPARSRARLLAAATDEFAEHGIAGARVDRIGAAAGVNKAQIYSYFGNKDQLFDLVLEMQVARLLDEVPFTADDLPGYAGRLFDYLLDHPHQLRLATWNRLERSWNHPAPNERATATRGKVTAIKRAQADGHVSASLRADDVLAFTMALTTAWTPVFPVPQGEQTPRQLRKHRGAIIEAVRRLTSG
jgi:AcrR family transcriptional regulator